MTLYTTKQLSVLLDMPNRTIRQHITWGWLPTEKLHPRQHVINIANLRSYKTHLEKAIKDLSSKPGQKPTNTLEKLEKFLQKHKEKA